MLLRAVFFGILPEETVLCNLWLIDWGHLQVLGCPATVSHFCLLLHRETGSRMLSSCCWWAVLFPCSKVLQVWLCSTECQRVATCKELLGDKTQSTSLLNTKSAFSTVLVVSYNKMIQRGCSLHPRGMQILICLVNISLVLYHNLRKRWGKRHKYKKIYLAFLVTQVWVVFLCYAWTDK